MERGNYRGDMELQKETLEKGSESEKRSEGARRKLIYLLFKRNIGYNYDIGCKYDLSK